MTDEKFPPDPDEGLEDVPQFPPLDEERVPQFEDTPLTRGEYIAALAHFYRAEMHRALIWRTRLDTTTNWAIVSTLAILTASLNSPQYATEGILLGMFANMVFLAIEARRFRFFDVWRARVRMIEENFYGPILRRDPHSPFADWGEHVAEDLLHPKFKITRMQAIRARLGRNFLFIFAFLLLAYLGHRIWPLAPDRFLAEVSNVPPWLPDLIVGMLYLFLLGIMAFTPRVLAPEIAYWPHPEKSGEDMSRLDV